MEVSYEGNEYIIYILDYSPTYQSLPNISEKMSKPVQSEFTPIPYTPRMTSDNKQCARAIFCNKRIRL